MLERYRRWQPSISSHLVVTIFAMVAPLLLMSGVATFALLIATIAFLSCCLALPRAGTRLRRNVFLLLIAANMTVLIWDISQLI